MPASNPTVLVTGAAGFIGAALVQRLLQDGLQVVGVDNLNSYYDPSLKLARLSNIDKSLTKDEKKWDFFPYDLQDKDSLERVFKDFKPSIVVNLAAQAGVRYSLKNPSAYIQSNLVGFANLLECCRNFKVDNLVYASSSSVYGGNENLPFRENQPVNHPVSLYAATKKSNELMAHSYSHLYGIPSTGLRFFTVYGPWGRPDMAPMIFARAILEKKPIQIFNFGKMKRDFTFIDDIVEGVIRCCYKFATPNLDFDSLNPEASTSSAPHRIFNIGNSEPIELLKFVESLENALGVKALKEFQPMQPGDVVATAADNEKLQQWINFSPKTSLDYGIRSFAEWFRKFYEI